VTDESLELQTRFVAPVGGVVVPGSGPVEDLYAPGRFVLPPLCVQDGCPAPLLEDEVVLSRWLVPRTKSSPAEVIGTYVQGGAEKRGPVARSSWYLLLTSRYVRILAVLAKDASVLTDDGWSTPAPGGWITFAFDLRTITHFSGSRRRVEFGSDPEGFTATAFIPATPEGRGWATPSVRSRTPDFAIELGRAILQAKRDSGDVDQEGAADAHGRSDWEERVVGRLRKADLSFPPTTS